MRLFRKKNWEQVTRENKTAKCRSWSRHMQKGVPWRGGHFLASLLEAGGNDGTPFSKAIYTYSQIICQANKINVLHNHTLVIICIYCNDSAKRCTDLGDSPRPKHLPADLTLCQRSVHTWRAFTDSAIRTNRAVVAFGSGELPSKEFDRLKKAS